MLQIIVPETELWDETSETFITIKEHTLQMEHSLISISKWEEKWHKSYLNTKDKTFEEIIDYFKCMTLTQNVKPEVYMCLTQDNINDINAYIDNPMTATVLPKAKNPKHSREIITNELIYYWMLSLQIPVEFQKWHLNRLITLIGVCNVKNEPPKKMSKRELMSRNAALNAARRKRLGTTG